MIFTKRFTRAEILEIMTALVEETLPNNKQGNLNLCYDSEGGVIATFIEDTDEMAQA